MQAIHLSDRGRAPLTESPIRGIPFACDSVENSKR